MSNGSVPENVVGEEISPTLDVVFGLLEILSALFGMILNMLVLPYFLLHKKAHLSRVLYILIAITDIVICFCSVPASISTLYHRAPMWLGNRMVCSFAGFLFNIASRMSVFLIAVLSLSRTISIFLPFRDIPSRVPSAIIFSYFVLNISLAALPLLFSSQGYVYKNSIAMCSWNIDHLSFVDNTKSRLYQTLSITFIIVPWLVPGVVAVASCLISIYPIVKSQNRSQTYTTLAKRMSAGEMSMINVRRTMILLTIVYIVFNIPCWLFYIVVLSSSHNPASWIRATAYRGYFFIFAVKLSVVLTSCINAIIYLCRMPVLRQTIFSKIVELTYLIFCKQPSKFSITSTNSFG